MELLLFLCFVFQASGSSQNRVAEEASLDVEVLGFSWSRYRGGVSTSERDDLGSPVSRQRVLRQQIENRNSVENRMQDLRDLEDRVYREKLDAPPKDTYSYRVELRNRGTRIIKWIFWDYQTSEPSDPDNISHRQFACAVKIKPNGSEQLRAFSVLPPRMVISANKDMKSPTENLVINRVEYADGAIWQRLDWRLPDQLTSRGKGRGKCRPI